MRNCYVAMTSLKKCINTSSPCLKSNCTEEYITTLCLKKKYNRREVCITTPCLKYKCTEECITTSFHSLLEIQPFEWRQRAYLQVEEHQIQWEVLKCIGTKLFLHLALPFNPPSVGRWYYDGYNDILQYITTKCCIVLTITVT